MKKNKVFTIPNILSFIRILLVPIIVWAYFNSKRTITALIILFSGLTDVVDGYIARHYNMITPLGKALDPIADKLTLLFTFICVCINNPIIGVLIVIFLLKEVFMTIQGLLIIKYTGTTYSAKWYGKAVTVILYAVVLTHVLWVNISFNVSIILVIVSSLSIIISLVLYTMMNFNELSDKRV